MRYLFAGYAALFVMASMMVHGILGYGFDFWRYLDIPTGVMILLVLMLGLKGPTFKAGPWLMAGLAGLLFYQFRTMIHAFPGDGAAASLKEMEVWVFRRLDELVRGGFNHAFLMGAGKSSDPLMLSMRAMQCYSIVFGVMTVYVVMRFMRDQASILLTLPLMLGFFGNMDSYAFSVFMAVVIGGWLLRQESLKGIKAVLAVVIVGVSLWIHPLFLFIIPILILVVCRAKILFWGLMVAWVAGMIGLLVYSGNANTLFVPDRVFVPPLFSIQTLAHYVGNMLVPLVPLIAVAVMRRWWTALGMFALYSVVFFCIRFTLGAADQWNYMQLLAFFALPFIGQLMRDPLPRGWSRVVVAAQLLFLVPAILVSSSDRTVQRALRVYPIDKCHHNEIMSWQTHLGLILMDSPRVDPSVVPEIFLDGVNNAKPKHRFKNCVLHVASLYNYGRIEEGRYKLKKLLKANPAVTSSFLVDRPCGIYHGKELLWYDVATYYGRNPRIMEAIKKARNGREYWKK